MAETVTFRIIKTLTILDINASGWSTDLVPRTSCPYIRFEYKNVVN